MDQSPPPPTPPLPWFSKPTLSKPLPRLLSPFPPSFPFPLVRLPSVRPSSIAHPSSSSCQPSPQQKVSSGFASVHPNNTCTVNAVEAYDLADFDLAAVKASLATAQQTLASASAELAKAEAQIEVDVLTVLEAAVKA